MSFDKKYTNNSVYPKGTTLNVRALPSTNSDILLTLKNGVSAGRTSGTYLNQTDGKWFQVNLTSPINGKQYGYTREDVIILKPANNNTVATDNGESLIYELVKNDIQTFHTLLRCFELLKKLKEKGVNIEDSSKQWLAIFQELSDRQNKIKTSKLLTYKQGYDTTYNLMVSDFKKLSGSFFGYKVGAVPLVAVVVISVIVGAGLAAVVYYAFKPDYDRGKVNLKSSDELEKALAALTPEEQAKLKDNLENQIDDAYNQGKTDQSGKDFWNIGKPVLMLFGGYMLFSWVRDRESKRKK